MSDRRSPPDPTLGTIGAAALTAGERGGVAASDERLGRIEERLTSIEPLLERLQAQSTLGMKIEAYVTSLQAEQRFFNAARWVLGGVWLAALLLLGWLLRDAIYDARSPLLRAPPVAIATFVIGMVSGIVLLLSGVARGVFRTAAERHAEGFLPPTLNAALEAYQKLIGRP